MKRLFDCKKFTKIHKDKHFVIGINEIGFGEYIDIQRKNSNVLSNITPEQLRIINSAFETKNEKLIDESGINPDILFGFLSYCGELTKSSIEFIQIDEEKIIDKEQIDELMKQFDKEMSNWVSECFFSTNKELFESGKKK